MRSGILGTSSPISSTNKTDRHDITEIVLKVALNTINQTIKLTSCVKKCIVNDETCSDAKGVNDVGELVTYVDDVWSNGNDVNAVGRNVERFKHCINKHLPFKFPIVA